MFIIYNLIGILITLISPIIIIYRIMVGKEDPTRFTERYCKYNEINNKDSLVWFHAASVGEMMSIVPIIRKFEKNKKIKKILLTTTTTSSANLFNKFNFKKTKHKYFPIDTNFFADKFVKFWRPNLAIFVESEIWPNMFKRLNSKRIPIILLNARITNKSFKKWIRLKNFSNNIFNKISLALPQNMETSKYLKILGVKKIQLGGNLKYYGNEIKRSKQTSFKKFRKYKVWCAASTHYNEEIIIGKIHKKLKKKNKKCFNNYNSSTH